MRRYPPSTIHRYLDMPSTQRIQTHISHRHNTAPPFQTLVQAPTHSTPIPPSPPKHKHRHTSNTPLVLTGLVKPKANTLIHAPPSPPTPPRAKYILVSHISPTPLIHSTSAVLDTIDEPRLPPTCPALTTTTPHPFPTPTLPSPSHPHSLSAYTHATQTTVHASQSHQPPHHHRVQRQPHRQTKYDHMTTETPQGQRPSSRRERNLTILQVNINEIKNKLEELKRLIHDTHADIITIQETLFTPKANTPKVHNFTTVRADKAGGGLITLIRDNITFTTTDIPSTINIHNTELQMVKVYINNTKHITIANMYIPLETAHPRNKNTADTDIEHCIQYITNIPHSVITSDVNAHSTLWHSYPDNHREHLIADVISNSDHITLNTNTPTRVPNTTLQQTSSPDITTVSNTL